MEVRRQSGKEQQRGQGLNAQVWGTNETNYILNKVGTQEAKGTQNINSKVKQEI